MEQWLQQSSHRFRVEIRESLVGTVSGQLIGKVFAAPRYRRVGSDRWHLRGRFVLVAISEIFEWVYERTRGSDEVGEVLVVGLYSPFVLPLALLAPTFGKTAP
jgi:hypothetical protein